MPEYPNDCPHQYCVAALDGDIEQQRAYTAGMLTALGRGTSQQSVYISSADPMPSILASSALPTSHVVEQNSQLPKLETLLTPKLNSLVAAQVGEPSRRDPTPKDHATSLHREPEAPSIGHVETPYDYARTIRQPTEASSNPENAEQNAETRSPRRKDSISTANDFDAPPLPTLQPRAPNASPFPLPQVLGGGTVISEIVPISMQRHETLIRHPISYRDLSRNLDIESVERLKGLLQTRQDSDVDMPPKEHQEPSFSRLFDSRAQSLMALERWLTSRKQDRANENLTHRPAITFQRPPLVLGHGPCTETILFPWKEDAIAHHPILGSDIDPDCHAGTVQDLETALFRRREAERICEIEPSWLSCSRKDSVSAIDDWSWIEEQTRKKEAIEPGKGLEVYGVKSPQISAAPKPRLAEDVSVPYSSDILVRMHHPVQVEDLFEGLTAYAAQRLLEAVKRMRTAEDAWCWVAVKKDGDGDAERERERERLKQAELYEAREGTIRGLKAWLALRKEPLVPVIEPESHEAAGNLDATTRQSSTPAGAQPTSTPHPSAADSSSPSDATKSYREEALPAIIIGQGGVCNDLVATNGCIWLVSHPIHRSLIPANTSLESIRQLKAGLQRMSREARSNRSVKANPHYDSHISARLSSIETLAVWLRFERFERVIQANRDGRVARSLEQVSETEQVYSGVSEEPGSSQLIPARRPAVLSSTLRDPVNCLPSTAKNEEHDDELLPRQLAALTAHRTHHEVSVDHRRRSKETIEAFMNTPTMASQWAHQAQELTAAMRAGRRDELVVDHLIPGHVYRERYTLPVDKWDRVVGAANMLRRSLKTSIWARQAWDVAERLEDTEKAMTDLKDLTSGNVDSPDSFGPGTGKGQAPIRASASNLADHSGGTQPTLNRRPGYLDLRSGANVSEHEVGRSRQKKNVTFLDTQLVPQRLHCTYPTSLLPSISDSTTPPEHLAQDALSAGFSNEYPFPSSDRPPSPFLTNADLSRNPSAPTPHLPSVYDSPHAGWDRKVHLAQQAYDAGRGSPSPSPSRNLPSMARPSLLQRIGNRGKIAIRGKTGRRGGEGWEIRGR